MLAVKGKHQPPCLGATISTSSASVQACVALRARRGDEAAVHGRGDPCFGEAELGAKLGEVLASVAMAHRSAGSATKHLRLGRARLDIVGDQLGQNGREQKAVPVKAVDVDIALRAAIILGRLSGKAGRAPAPCSDDLGLAEGRVERVGGAQKVERRAHADRPRLLALDDGGADHVDARRPRARRRAESADAAGGWAASSATSRALHHDALAAHAAQVPADRPWRRVPRQSMTRSASAGHIALAEFEPRAGRDCLRPAESASAGSGARCASFG